MDKIICALALFGLVGCFPKLPEIPDISEVEIPELEIPAAEIPDVKPQVTLPTAP